MGGESLPTGWQLVKLGDLGEVNRGRSRHRPRYTEHLYGGPYPFIQTGDIKNSGGRITTYQQTYSEAGLAQSRLWPAGAMCITIAANIAETAILSFPACFPDSVVGFIADEAKCDVRFVEFTFRHLRQHIQHEASGSVQDNINLATLDRLRFPLPPLSEQRAIAHILGALDDKIELNRRMNATLEAIAQAIFKSWFVEFDPVRAKAAGRQPYGMDEKTAALFPDGFEESELGPVPRGWRVTNLGQLITADKGLSYKGKFLSDGIGLPMINLGCFAGKGKFRQEKVKYYTGEFRPRHLVREGAIVIANTDVTQKRVVLGSPAIVPKINDEEEYLYTHHVYALRFQPETELWRIYVYFSLLRPEFREIAEGFATGTTVLALPRDAILNYTLCLPPELLLQVFKNQVAVIHKMVQSNLDEAKILGILRDTLLPKLLSGEVRVKEAERMAR